MERVLERLNIDVLNVRGNEILALCPGHLEITGKEDHNPSWWINAETGAHICFSCGFKGNIWSLIATAQNLKDANGFLDYADAKDWLYLSFDNIQLGSPDEEIEQESIFKEVPQITESRLALFTYPPDHALKARGLTLQAAEKHQLLWDTAHSNWITVIRDPYLNKLLGWQEKGFSRRYFRNYPTGVEKSTTLFGLNRYKGGRMIIVESPLDVVRLESIGVSGGVSTYGSMISNAQIELIKDADEILFALDNDESGINASKKMLEQNFEAWFFSYAHTDMKDIGAMSRLEILTGIDNAKHSVNGLGAIE
ncbi:Bacterial DnaG primase, TOPRIM domain [uncultured Caudovirales phage]|uniref:Bacterial DnaG primase, TOPRIM domain n=1 Tax=uncultured Caudovirales phage TaxID=2100421 RepID=A0A6J5LCS9_9CAUD|nr:Bacterial DnaG primase, TOPRIM domain [uncultured Caudovirales phage]